MNVSAAGATGSTSSGSSVYETTQKELGQETFLRLLVTELKSQDPLNPMDDKDFIAQLAQFSSLEQLQSIDGSMERLAQTQSVLQATGLIGHAVEAVDPESGELVKGSVESVTVDSGAIYLRVGDSDIPLSNVLNIS